VNAINDGRGMEDGVMLNDTKARGLIRFLVSSGLYVVGRDVSFNNQVGIYRMYNKWVLCAAINHSNTLPRLLHSIRRQQTLYLFHKLAGFHLMIRFVVPQIFGDMI